MTADPATPADLARDLEADLAVCATAPPGPWQDDGPDKFRGDDPWCHVLLDGSGDLLAQVDCDFPESRSHAAGAPECGRARAAIAFMAAARDGWPAALRRALAAEAEVDRLRYDVGLQRRLLESDVQTELRRRQEIDALNDEVNRLRALLDGGAEQVHRMGRELAALRRQLADAHAALREYREDEG
jgi:hypothetical protein